MELLLKNGGKVSGHLSDCIAAGISDPGMGVVDVVHDPLHQLVEVRLHLLVTSLAGGRDGHQSGVSALPV